MSQVTVKEWGRSQKTKPSKAAVETIQKWLSQGNWDIGEFCAKHYWNGKEVKTHEG